MKLSQLNEYSGLARFVKNFQRSPKQTHPFFHSDAEILELSKNNYLAISLDIVGDEQAWSLIQDPKNMGYHSLESALSDLAAVGVVPAGFIQGLIIGRNQDPQFVESILKGINESCTQHGIFLYGGDTASGLHFSVHLTVMGHSTTKPITRHGLGVGDKIYSTGFAGKGNALVAERWFKQQTKMENEKDFLACARIKESQVIKKYATTMIDSSDGFLNSIDLLCRVNELGIQCLNPLNTYLHPLAQKAAAQFKLSPWTLLAGEFGDYELIFSVPEKTSLDFEKEYSAQFSNLNFIGEAILTKELRLLNSKNSFVHYEASTARNLYRDHSKTQKDYVEAFLALGQSLGF